MFHPTTRVLALVSVLLGFVVLHLDATSLCLLVILSIVAVPPLHTARVQRWLEPVWKGVLRGWGSRADVAWTWVCALAHPRHQRTDPVQAAPSETLDDRQLEEERLQSILLERLAFLGEDLDGFTYLWDGARRDFFTSKQLPAPTITPPSPYRHLQSEHRALQRALTHLASPERSARLSREDRTFYEEWVSEFNQRLGADDAAYSRYEQDAKLELEYAKKQCAQLEHFDRETQQEREYQQLKGALDLLECVVYDGSMHPASALPLIEAYQRRIKERLEYCLGSPF